MNDARNLLEDGVEQKAKLAATIPPKIGGGWAKDALTRLEDPLAQLPPTARRVLEGAMRVVVTEGFGKLTLARIAAESGENVAAVKYYFGNKAGLVSVMLQVVVFAELNLLVRNEEDAVRKPQMSRLASEVLALSTPGEPLRVLFELLPHALRDASLREHLRRYYSTFFQLHLEQLGLTPTDSEESVERLSGLAMLLTAVSDGLTIQALVAPNHFDLVKAMRAFDALASFALDARD